MSEGLTPEQVKAGRALLAWSQQELATEARVSPSTIADFERGVRTPVANNAQAIRDALERKGLQFFAGGVVEKDLLPRQPTLRPGTLMRWITATDLAQWGERRDGQSGMPELVRRLIFATLGPAAEVTFPSGDSVQYPGWDGVCITAEGRGLVPAGGSAWEIGAQRAGIRNKADKDFKKRSAEPLNVDPAQTTFVFVTPQRFPRKEGWSAEKRASGPWRDVRVIDADDLVHWLETYPAVAQWLAVLVGRRPRGLRNISEAWDEWCRATRIPLTADIMVTDRDQEAADVLKWLKGPPSELAIQAGSVDEAIAFLRAAIDPLPAGHRLAYESRCLVVADVGTARDLVGIGSRLIIVLQGVEAGLAQRLVADGHHVYAAYGPEVRPVGNARELTRPWRQNLKMALSRMGVTDEEAHRLSKGSGRSLAVLRRLMPAAPLYVPRWAIETPPDLIAAMMAGGWDEKSAADRKVVARLAGRSYEQVEEVLVQLTSGPEAPLLRSGSIWKLVSLRDSWTLLASRLTLTQLQRFEEAFHEVLSTRNPRFNIAGREAWFEREGQFGEEISDELRRGLTEAMVALGVYPEAASGIPDGARRADEAVRKLLHAADAELWWSLTDDFRRLAEASPRSFLESVEAGLDAVQQPIMSLFRSDDGFITDREYLSDLLWALEMLARSPDHLLQAALLLARLDAVDPGGRWSNRPGASLRRIFVSWRPQTYATPEQRLKVIDAILRAFPQVGWNLLVKLAPRTHDTSDDSPYPDWRDFTPDEREVITRPAIHEAGRAIGRRLLESAGMDIGCWRTLLGLWANFEKSWRDEASSRLGAVARQLNDPAEVEALRDELRDLLVRHRSFADTAWAMPEADLASLEAVFETLQPKGVQDRLRWLFRPTEYFMRPNVSWHDLQADRNKLQCDAAIELLAALGPEELFQFAETITMHHALGFAIARAAADDSLKWHILQMGLQSTVEAHADVATGLLLGLADNRTQWLMDLWTRALTETWGDKALLRIASSLPANPETWSKIAAVSEEMEQAYWKTQPIHQFPSGSIEIVADKLIDVGRSRDVVNWLGHHLRDKPPGGLLVRALQAAVHEPVPTGSNDATMFTYHLGLILDHLEKDPSVNEDELVRLEWIYFQALRYSQRPARFLHRALARNPQFFVELIGLIFLPAAESGVVEEPPTDLEQAQTMAGQAFDVLHDWAHVPGADDNGLIDATALEDWVKKARKLLAQAGRIDIGDQRIGEILAKSVRQPDEPWPPRPVREVIEVCRSRHLETGLEIGVYNYRGVTVRSPHDGGVQERDLADRYRRDAETMRFDWPRTAATLDRIAESFARDAEREDQSADQRDWQ
jgi:transcriptional regulator with XRE-family HTH domain